ncbi:MAG: BlaI/MecI/CopY family transcriptional regulator [Clostridia bacterium]|nr:BlaI/MecI/CopY family transcriptional regulator [Clostridia bacterium]
MKLSDAEWAVLEILWGGHAFTLGEITASLKNINGWSSKTVYTYLTRMEAKGLVAIDRSINAPYSAALAREECVKNERHDLLNRAYKGAAGDLIAAFLKESSISAEEKERLRSLLDDMEV